MALNKYSLAEMEQIKREGSSHVPELKDEWNTFQYVANYLDKWAEGTEIGAEQIEKLKNHCKRLEDFIERIEQAFATIDEYRMRQEEINRGQ